MSSCRLILKRTYHNRAIKKDVAHWALTRSQLLPFIIENDSMYIPLACARRNFLSMMTLVRPLKIDKDKIDSIYSSFPESRDFLKKDSSGNYTNQLLADILEE